MLLVQNEEEGEEMKMFANLLMIFSA